MGLPASGAGAHGAGGADAGAAEFPLRPVRRAGGGAERAGPPEAVLLSALRADVLEAPAEGDAAGAAGLRETEEQALRPALLRGLRSRAGRGSWTNSYLIMYWRAGRMCGADGSRTPGWGHIETRDSSFMPVEVLCRMQACALVLT